MTCHKAGAGRKAIMNLFGITSCMVRMVLAPIKELRLWTEADKGRKEKKQKLFY